MRSGTISASGTSTNARANSRGCGSSSLRRLHCEIVIGKEVDINRARTPAAFLAALASECVLDCLRPRQQLARRQTGLDCDAKIDEGRLTLEAPGGRAVVRGAGREACLVVIAEQRDGSIKRVARIAHVCAKPDQRLRHELNYSPH